MSGREEEGPPGESDAGADGGRPGNADPSQSGPFSGLDANPLRRWFLYTGSRLSVTAVLLAGVFCTLLGLGLVRPVDMHRLVSETPAAREMFTALLRGAILLVSIVVSINSIVLSQEITDIESQRDRVEGSIEYRRRIEELIEADVSPTQPGHFMAAILSAVAMETKRLDRFAEAGDDPEFRADVDAFVAVVREDVIRARRALGSAGSGTFEVLLAGLNYDYSTQLTAARQLRREFGEDVDEDRRQVLDDLVDTLEFFAVGREYFKSLYYKRELARLSKWLLYVSLPVIVFTSYVILALDVDLLPDWSFGGLSSLYLLVAFAYTVALSPFVVLTAYVVRLAAISLRTLAAGPFLVNEGHEPAPFDWNRPEDPLAADPDATDESGAVGDDWHEAGDESDRP